MTGTSAGSRLEPEESAEMRDKTTDRSQSAPMTREEILAVLERGKPLLEARFGVRSLALFGSYAIGEATAGSDVDILVDVDPAISLRFVDLAETIEEQLGLPVDLVSARGVKPRYWDRIKDDLVYV
jgi:predicted nucleotidyltransferase